MSAIDKLRAENLALRLGLVETVHEKQALQEHIARQDIRIKALLRDAGLAPHDWEPARPGIEDVD